ncbi:MAG: GTPase HflX [Bryobacteraceae bacterium]
MPPVVRERAILVGLELKGRPARRPATAPEAGDFDSGESIEELAVLAESAGAEVVEQTVQSRESAEAATLVGSGKVETLSRQAASLEADLVIFDQDLSPTQQRNLERALPCKVIDRTQLILDIFAARARTREGQLQVELAQLNYLLPRLAGRGVLMSRLGGGIGTRGPGETQLETDRRRIFRKIRKIEEDLEAVRSSRAIQRRQRQAVPLATVGLAGYTNAGKSTLFRALTGADVLADARMFATLDPTVRQFVLPSHRRILLSDTVGFIRNLPPTLVQAFRATLEEVTEAALLLHVVDVTSPHAAQHTEHVFKVLAEIGAASTPQLLVLNKVDLLPDKEAEAGVVSRRILGNVANLPNAPPAVAVSARTGEGIPDLLAKIDEMLALDPVSLVRFRIPHSEGSSLHFLHENARVIDKGFTEEYSEVVAEVPESVRKRLARYVTDTV